MDKKQLLKSIPKVDELLNDHEIVLLQKDIHRSLIAEAIRQVLERMRSSIMELKTGEEENFHIDRALIIEDIKRVAADKNSMNLKRVINCTGIIIHTNLGRSILSKRAIQAVIEVAGNYSNLEYDLNAGKRGLRYSNVEESILSITGAEDVLVVNNNAGAVLLALSTMCKNMEAIVSRGELVEVGGSFRIPDVMEQSGARLIEVGSTNRTHLKDFETAINENTAVLLKVHTSNYRILGFTESVRREDMAALGKKYNLPVLEDIGSGSFIDFSKYGLKYEPTVQDSLKSGIDVVTFSGDKMLGGPQAGIIAGKKKYIEKMKRNPLTRALRVDKMTLSALEATVREYIDEDSALKSIPTLRMIVESRDELKSKARRLCAILKRELSDKADIRILEDNSQIGGGAMPLELLPTFVVSVKPFNIKVNKAEESLRNAQTPIIVRINKDMILFDVRTIERNEFKTIKDTLSKIL